MWRGRSKNKYGNTKVSHAGQSFASKGEAGLYDFLKLLEMAGEIRGLKSQVYVYLTKARIAYIADFSYERVATGQVEYAEYKGFETPEWRIKRRLWEYYGPGDLLVYKASSRGPVLKETLKPKT